MDANKLVNIMNTMRKELHQAYNCEWAKSKDPFIKSAIGKLDVLIELLKK